MEEFKAAALGASDFHSRYMTLVKTADTWSDDFSSAGLECWEQEVDAALQKMAAAQLLEIYDRSEAVATNPRASDDHRKIAEAVLQELAETVAARYKGVTFTTAKDPARDEYREIANLNSGQRSTATNVRPVLVEAAAREAAPAPAFGLG